MKFNYYELELIQRACFLQRKNKKLNESDRWRNEQIIEKIEKELKIREEITND